MGGRTNTPLERAIVRRICAHLGADAEPSGVDCDAALFDPQGFYIASYALDSLSLAEMIVMLEGDLDVGILGCAGAEEMGSVAAIAAYAARAAQPETIAAFERQWCT